MAGKISVNKIQLGDSVTATQNFVLQTNVDGTVTLARGNDGATTQDILTVDANGIVTVTQGVNGLVSKSPTVAVGYGIGAGGSVTQLTSKATGVTLNKPSGQITMHNAALAAGAIVSFTLSNSVIAGSDVFVLSCPGGGTVSAYNIWTQVYTGNCLFYVKNISAGSLSEALVINFSILKGATT